MQTTASKLEAEFIEKRVTNGRRMLSDDGKIAGLLGGRAGCGVLAEVLILRVYLNARKS